MYIFVMLNIILISFYNMEKCIPQQSCDPFIKVYQFYVSNIDESKEYFDTGMQTLVE